MPEYDLTTKVAQYLDRHMIFPLLEFLSSRKIYDEKSILTMKLDLLNNTNMVDFAVDCYRNLYAEDEIPERKKTLTKTCLQIYRSYKNKFDFIINRFG
jgi:translation initiation factor 3 subunit E